MGRLSKDAHLGAARTPRASLLTSSVAAITVDEVADPPSSESLIASTMEEPTTTPSAVPARAPAVSGVLPPNPTASGSFVSRLRRDTLSPTSLTAGVAAPVIPVIQTNYVNPP